MTRITESRTMTAAEVRAAAIVAKMRGDLEEYDRLYAELRAMNWEKTAERQRAWARDVWIPFVNQQKEIPHD